MIWACWRSFIAGILSLCHVTAPHLRQVQLRAGKGMIMLDAFRVAESMIGAINITGGLSGAASHILEGDASGAIAITLIASACVVILTGTVALAELRRMKVREYVRKREERPQLPKSRDKEGTDAS